MQTIDWLLVAVPIVFFVALGVYTRRFLKSVADFVAGGRHAGRYLICNARGETGQNAANSISKFQVLMVSGFCLAFWEKISVPIMLLIAISGFVIYRYRETRALTVAQFFEMRYSRSFRLFMGVLAAVAGLLNFGIIPAVGARFFVGFLGWPERIHIAGMNVQTYVLLMACYLPLTFAMTITGGQITLMVVDCVEGILSHIVYVIVIVTLLWIIPWSHVVYATSSPTMVAPDHSMLNPFDAFAVSDFSFWFIVGTMLMRAYGTMAWQGGHMFNSSARTPHESRMGGVLGNWREYVRTLLLMVVAIYAFTYLEHPAFSAQAASAWQRIHVIQNPKIASQMTVPVAMGSLLPAGVKGLFLLVMILGVFAGDGTHMQSWGSIIVQDCVLPVLEWRDQRARRNGLICDAASGKLLLSPAQHIRLLRWCVAFVGIFGFFFSWLFTQTQYITMWWSVTTSVFAAGAGSAIIGGLYWRRGTTAGAWAAVIVGAVLSLAGIWAHQHWRHFPINGLWINVIASAVAVVCYVLISLLTCRRPFDLDRMLHRVPGQRRARRAWTLGRLIGIDSDFSFADKLVAGGLFWWSMLLLFLNLAICAWNFNAFYPAAAPGHEWLANHWAAPWPTSWWARYWAVMGIVVPLIIALITLVWFSYGGFIDIRQFFHDLKVARRNALDDGRVIGHLNADETPAQPLEKICT